MKELLVGAVLLVLAVVAVTIVLLLTWEDSVLRWLLAALIVPFGVVAAVIGGAEILLGWDRVQRERRRGR